MVTCGSRGRHPKCRPKIEILRIADCSGVRIVSTYIIKALSQCYFDHRDNGDRNDLVNTADELVLTDLLSLGAKITSTDHNNPARNDYNTLDSYWYQK